MSLIPCPTCHSHVLNFERTCPHCGTALRSSGNPAAPIMAMTLGLALTACRAEPDYGVPDTSTDDVETATGTDTGDSTGTTGTTTGESEYGVPDTGEATDTTTDTTTAEPDYGVPDTGTDTSTDSTGAEPDYGVPDTGTDTTTG